MFAVASTALAYTGIGLIGSIAAGAGMDLAQYTLDSPVFHDDFSLSGALIATGLGALGGLDIGRGAQHFKSIGSNLDDTGRTGVKAILTAFDKYGTGTGYQKVMKLWEVEWRILLRNLFFITSQRVHGLFGVQRLQHMEQLVGQWQENLLLPEEHHY